MFSATSASDADSTGRDVTPVIVGVGPLTPADVAAVARRHAPVEIADEALSALEQGRAVIERLAADTVPHYGVSTGFGALATRSIAPDDRARLQESLVRSHAAGVGPEVETEVVRAMMLLRLSTLATGHTGVRVETAQAYAAFLNAGLTPVVHEYGSLGCSGDLAPLAHCALAVMGEGDVRDREGRRIPAAEALRAHGLTSLRLVEKEGLALLNGTDGMTGMVALALADTAALLTVADIVAALSVEALLGSDAVFADELMTLRPHPGQRLSAAVMRAVLAGSAIRASHDHHECRIVQDAYSLRCAPQVHGAVRDTLDHVRMVVERELASAVDNPVVTDSGRLSSNGNFHGAPMAYVADFLAIAVADLASISERRTDRFLDVSRSHGLPAFLAGDPGVDSGHMIAQYTQAAMVSEMKRLAVPASVDSIPSSAMQEDHVSMGWSAARKLRRALTCLSDVLAVEALTAVRAAALRAPLAPAAAGAAVCDLLHSRGWEGPGPDRFLAVDLEIAGGCVRDGSLTAAVRRVVDLPA